MSDKLERINQNLNQSLSHLQPSAILAFNDSIRDLKQVIKLTLGEPDFMTPEVVKAGAIASIQANHSHYAPSNGLPALRQAITSFLMSHYHLQYDSEREIVVTAGASGAIYSTLTAILNPGDQVLVPIPIFPPYIPIAQLNGAEPIFIDTRVDGFKLTPKRLQAALNDHQKVKALILNYPNNPTGVTYSEQELADLGAVIAATDVLVVSDEIYSELTYDHAHVSLAKFCPEQTIVINGVSKSHAMTGWRIGYLAAPAPIAQRAAMVNQFTITSTATVAQEAALTALTTGLTATKPMREAYQRRRDWLIPELKSLGFGVVIPQGAFYLFLKIPANLPQNSLGCAQLLAREAGVALIPGSAFPAGEGYLRLSYAASDADLHETVARLRNFMTSGQGED